MICRLFKYIKILIVLFVYHIDGITQPAMEVEGTIRIGDSSSTPAPGTIRWDGLNFEGWNGYAWIPLTSFKINTIITDYEGHQYPTVYIGNQHWMAKNLNATKYANGDGITNKIDNYAWAFSFQGAYCWYDNIGPRGATGALYKLVRSY